jgi:alkylation response protein AidB-like acyl-CoA dehydrogenase
VCFQAIKHKCADMLHIHGAMGFTWEHPAHLYFKRAKAIAVLFG